MRVLVTGATGYLGRAVVLGLRDAGHQVVAVARHLGGDLPTDVESRRADVTEPDSIRRVVADVDAVCHLAGLARAREAAAHPALYYRVNLTGTLNVLDALVNRAERTGSAGRFVFASTGAVYGTPERQPVPENSPTLPLNVYGATKMAAEQAIGWHAATGLLGATVLRIFNAAGAIGHHGDPDLSRIMPKVAAAASGRVPGVDVNGDGSAIRDFVHIADIAEAFVRAVVQTEAGKTSTHNVGATHASVRDILTATERLTGRTVPVRHHPANPHEAPLLTADTRSIRDELLWTPTCSSLDELIASQLASRG